MSLEVSTIQFAEDGSVLVTFMDTVEDIRNRGLVVQTHQVHVFPGKGGRDYGDEIEDIREAAKRLVKDAMDDFNHTEPAEGEEWRG